MGRLKIVDVSSDAAKTPLVRRKLPEDFGRNLDTIAKAREWLTHPDNWLPGRIFILKWDGLTPKISAYHGERLANEPWDNGIPEVVVREQIRIRMGAKPDTLDDIQDQT